MSLRIAKLVCLSGCIVIILFASFCGAQASLCMSSAKAVKSAYPWAHPHWTIRAHKHNGAKCWHAGTDLAAHSRHSKTTHQQTLSSPKAVVSGRGSSPKGFLPAVSDTSGTGWNLQVPAAAVDASPAPGPSSFAERFSAIFEVVFFERTSLVRHIEDLASSRR